MACLCEGGNEPPGSLKAKQLLEEASGEERADEDDDAFSSAVLYGRLDLTLDALLVVRLLHITSIAARADSAV
ncbi:hypothetical protein ANN_26364 [Periplaneta americana]|uniref:Per a allergen n=1 Tax=Periplaneta americana TaxID=6978 RepID=A0ABQ8RXV7_PERAM|nr:hypothetical protein ANN_26364 [Periplaneta americana]